MRALCFNLLENRGLGSWIILNLLGTYNRFAISKFFLKFCTDRTLFERSLVRILDEDFDNVVMGHGSVAYGGAKAKLKDAIMERGLLQK